MPNAVQMPRYRRHKTVSALEIERVTFHEPGDPIVYFTDLDCAPRRVKINVVSRYSPVSGDFFVVYGDGYESVIPRRAFLESYDKV